MLILIITPPKFKIINLSVTYYTISKKKGKIKLKHKKIIWEVLDQQII